MISIQHLTAEDFRQGKLKSVFPELYELRKVVENNASGSHRDQNAFENTLESFGHLKGALKSMRLGKAREKKVRDVLAEQVQEYDGWQLLLIAVLVKNIGKKSVLRKNAGVTTAVGYELKSAELLPQYKFRLGLGNKDLKYLHRIVKYHTSTWQLITRILADEKNWQKYWEPYKARFRNHTYGLLLLGYADLLASTLNKAHKQEFVQRSLIYKRLLGSR